MKIKNKTNSYGSSTTAPKIYTFLLTEVVYIHIVRNFRNNLAFTGFN